MGSYYFEFEFEELEFEKLEFELEFKSEFELG
jgi:hypothetical protein